MVFAEEASVPRLIASVPTVSMSRTPPELMFIPVIDVIPSLVLTSVLVDDIVFPSIVILSAINLPPVILAVVVIPSLAIIGPEKVVSTAVAPIVIKLGSPVGISLSSNDRNEGDAFVLSVGPA